MSKKCRTVRGHIDNANKSQKSSNRKILLKLKLIPSGESVTNCAYLYFSSKTLFTSKISRKCNLLMKAYYLPTKTDQIFYSQNLIVID